MKGVVNIIFRFKGYGLLALVIQGVIGFICICVGMVYESRFWGTAISDIFVVLCVEAGLIISLPFLYMLQKWLDKKGRYEDSVFNKRPFNWGLICCGGMALIIIATVILTSLL